MRTRCIAQGTRADCLSWPIGMDITIEKTTPPHPADPPPPYELLLLKAVLPNCNTQKLRIICALDRAGGICD